MGILVWNFPEDLLPDGFLNLAVPDESSLLVPVQHHPESFSRNFLAGQIIEMTNHIAQGRNFGDRYHMELVAVTDHLQVLITQPWWHIDQDEVIAHPQEIECLRHSARKNAPRGVVAFGRGD